LLNKPDDAASYAAEAASTKQVFNARYFQPEKEQYDSGSQTADAMPLAVGLVPERHRDQVLASLIADIRKHDNHVTAGDVGFHYVVRALMDGDRSDVLYDMFTRTDKPSYGDQLMHRATTLTEAWDANPESSQNHFMLGHAEEWFYRGLAGIDFDMSRQGAERIRIHPSAPGDLHSAGATYESGLGKIVSRWSRRGETLELEIAVPAAATVVFPRGYAATTTATKSTKSSEVSREIVVRAGSYHFNLKKD
jgi:alpha-L-rhamnosidase